MNRSGAWWIVCGEGRNVVRGLKMMCVFKIKIILSGKILSIKCAAQVVKNRKSLLILYCIAFTQSVNLLSTVVRI